MFIQIFKETLMITSFVLVMMLIIEYFTVQSKGRWSQFLKKNTFFQILFSALMGITPGCLGTYAIVSLYTHRVIGFAALVTAMIATSGDEIFVMFSLIPEKAFMLIALLLGISIVSGFITHAFFRGKEEINSYGNHIQIHNDESCVTCRPKDFISQLKNITFHRALLVGGLLTFIVLLLSGEIKHQHILPSPAKTEIQHDHDHDHASEISADSENKDVHDHEIHWELIVFTIISFIGLFIVATVPDHFLTKHLWEHVIKKHFLKIFLWTLGALFIIHFITDMIDVQNWIRDNKYIILVVAVLSGLIPESGPHIVFITLYASGAIPFSLLLANSIVQDGHGAIPLLAESRKSFFAMKGINAIVGLIAGIVGILVGF